MKKIICVFLLLIFAFYPTQKNVVLADTESNSFIISTNSAVVYDSPLFSSNQIGTLSHKEIVTIELQNGEIKTYDCDGFQFCKIIQYKNAVDAYILKDCIAQNSTQITTKPNFNAQTNCQCKVYFKDGENYAESEITLSKTQRICLYEGYNSKKDFNAISFVYNNEVMYGYIQSKNINPDGVDPAIITVIVVASSIIGILFAFLFIKRHTKKKKIKKMARIIAKKALTK